MLRHAENCLVREKMACHFRGRRAGVN